MATIMAGIAVVGLVVFFFYRKQFDFVSVAFIGMLIYFSPGFYGYVANPYRPDEIPSVPIYDEAYYVWFAALVALIITGVIYNPRVQKVINPIATDVSFDIVLNVLTVLSFILWYLTAGNGIFSADKFEVLESVNRFNILFTSLVQLGLIVFLIQGKWLNAIIPILSVIFLMYVGFRSDIALAAIGVITYIAYVRGIRSFLRPRYVIPVLLLAVTLLAYKPFLVAYRSGHIERVFALLADPDFASQALLGSEPFITQATLNSVVGRGYTTDTVAFILSFIGIIPFLLPILGIRTDELAFQFQEQLFPMVPYGLGSNIYGNFFAALGIAGLILFIVAHCILLVAFSRKIGSGGMVMGPLYLMWGAFFAFYIHRNDLLNTLSFVNRPVVATVLIYVISRIFAGKREVRATNLQDRHAVFVQRK